MQEEECCAITFSQCEQTCAGCDLEQFYLQVESKLQVRGKSLRWLANEVDVQPRSLQTAFSRRQRKMDFETILQIATLLGISIDALKNDDVVVPNSKARQLLTAALSLAAEGEQTPSVQSKLSVDDFLNWWFLSKGRLSKNDKILDRIDVFEPPKLSETRIRPLQTGPNSLASIKFDISSPNELIETLNGFSQECNDQLVKAHLEAIRSGEPVLSHPTLDEPLRDGSQFNMRYRRILAPMRYKGAVVIVNYSDAIRDPDSK